MPSLRQALHVSPLVVLFLTAPAAAQVGSIGPGVSIMARGGEGISPGGCGGDRHFLGPALHGSRRLGQLVSLHLGARAYWHARGSGCVSAPEPPPPDGVFIQEERVALQSNGFVMTDARIGVALPSRGAVLSAGGGTAWRNGRNVPYFVAALGLPFVEGVVHRFGFQFEYHWMHVTSDRFRRTFQNGQIVAQQALGEAHRWSYAVTLGFRWEFPIFGKR